MPPSDSAPLPPRPSTPDVYPGQPVSADPLTEQASQAAALVLAREAVVAAQNLGIAPPKLPD